MIEKLNNVEWKEYVIEDLFHVDSGVRLTKKDMKDGDIPFVGATDNNNGITNFISNMNNSYDTNILGVNYNGSVVESFYHPYGAIFSDDVKRLSLKNNKGNKYLYLFIKVMILQQKEKYMYAYKFNSKRMNKQKIILPTGKNGEPDWEFMENYMKDIEKEVKPDMRFEPHVVYDERELEDVDWKEFVLQDIATITGGKDIYSTERIPGDTPYITSTALMNGIGYFVSNNNDSLEKNCISINRNGSVGFAFYHNYYALFGNDVRKVRLNNSYNENKYVSLFITTVLMKQKEKYSYSVKMGTKRLQRQKIMLPITLNNEPDWEFMEQYMKRMENELMGKVLLNKY